MPLANTGRAAPLLILLATSLTLPCLTGCGSDITRPAGGTTSGPAPLSSTLYMAASSATQVLPVQVTATSTVTGTALNVPSFLSVTLLAVDPKGNLYVGGTVSGNAQQCEVLVYPAGASGSATPTRSVVLEPGALTALAADSSGQIYAGQSNTLSSVKVYAATANGSSTASVVLNPTSFRYINDVAVDTTGRIFVSGYNGGAYFIDTFAAGASGAATPTATLYAPSGSYFGGIALDASGNLWAVEQLTIVEFAPGASGTPTPLTSINLQPVTAPYTGQTYSNVLRIDSNGYLYIPVVETGASVVTGFTAIYSPTQSGTPLPLETVTSNDIITTSVGSSIPLAVR